MYVQVRMFLEVGKGGLGYPKAQRCESVCHVLGGVTRALYMNSFSMDVMEKEQRPKSQSHFEDSLGEASVWDLDLFLEDSYSQPFFFCTQMVGGCKCRDVCDSQAVALPAVISIPFKW